MLQTKGMRATNTFCFMQLIFVSVSLLLLENVFSIHNSSGALQRSDHQ